MKKYLFLIILLLLLVILFGIYFINNNLYNYQINILGDKEIEISVNEKYNDPGVEIIHNKKKVNNYTTINNVDTSKIGTYEVIYKIKKVEKKRKVTVVDKENPIITFNDKLKKYHIKNTDINLLDYVTASDNYDGDITNKIQIETDLDTKKEGIYKVVYKVSDSSNNTSTIETTINVQDKETDGIPVLMYHWFYDDTKGEKAGTKNSHNYISKTTFEKQIKYLKDNNYYFPTWNELENYIDGKIELPKKSVILTDDDCVKSFFTVALPILNKYEIPMTSFCISNKSTYQNYLKEEYIDFQSHTDSLHQRICKTAWDGAVMCKPYNTIYEDIKLSIEKFGKKDSFAYPFGHYNDNTIKALKANGIRLAFTINEGNVKRKNNKYKLPRVRIASWTTMDTYKKLVK